MASAMAITSRGLSAFRVSAHRAAAKAAAVAAFSSSARRNEDAPRITRSKEAARALQTDPRAMSVPKLPNIGTTYMRAPMSLLIPAVEKNLYRRFRARVGFLVGAYGRSNVTGGVAFSLAKDLQLHQEAHQKFYNEVLGLDTCYQTWLSVNHLQMWMLLTRLRKEPKNANLYNLASYIVTEFFHVAEKRLYLKYNIKSGRKVNKVLAENVQQHHGSMLAYDEGFIRGDAVLAMALWRNVFSGKRNATPRQLALLVQHVRRQLYLYDRTPVEYFVDSGTLPLLVPLTRLVNVDDIDSSRLEEPHLFAEKLEELPPEILQNPGR